MLLDHVSQLLIDSSLLSYPLQDPLADNITEISAKFWLIFARSYMNSVAISKNIKLQFIYVSICIPTKCMMDVYIYMDT